jgi:hypothetical protein
MPLDTPFRNAPGHFQSFNDHVFEGGEEGHTTPDLGGPGLGAAPSFRPYSRQSAHHPRANVGYSHLPYPSASSHRDEASSWSTWRGENVAGGGRSLSSHVRTGPPGAPYLDQSPDVLLSQMASEIRFLSAQVKALEDKEAKRTQIQAKETGRLDNVEARLNALEETPGEGAGNGKTASKADKKSRGPPTMNPFVKVSQELSLLILFPIELALSPLYTQCTLKCAGSTMEWTKRRPPMSFTR